MKKLFKYKAVKIIAILELAILLYFGINCFTSRLNVTASYNDINYINGNVIDNQGIYINSEICQEKSYFTYGPNYSVKAGIYEVTLNYATNGLNNTVIAGGAKLYFQDLLMDNFKLDGRYDTVTFDVWVKKNTPSFSISTIFDGQSDLLIKSLSIKETITGRIYSLVKYILFALAIDLIIILVIYARGGVLNPNKVIINLILIGIIVMASYPLFTIFLVDGDDLKFHLLRIEGIREGLLAGQFPVRIHPTQYNGNGYATPLFYGEILLYIPAVMRLIGFTLQDSYKIFLILVNIATAWISYGCFKKISKNDWISLAATFLYVLAPYRLTNIYVRGAVGEYCAMIFWPVIAYGLYSIYMYSKDSKEFKNAWIYLVLGYSGVIQTHMLSCEIAAAVSIVICLILYKKTFTKDIIISFIKFFGYTLLINAFFLFPFLGEMIKGGYRITDIGSVQTNAIQGNGMYPAHLFNLFVSGSGMAYGHGVEDYRVLGMRDEMGTTVGLALIFPIIIYGVMVLVNGKKVKEHRYGMFGGLVCLGSVLALYMSTCMFPWDFLCDSLGKLVINLQFPWRFLSIASILCVILFICVCDILNELYDKRYIKGFVLCVVIVNLITTSFMLYNRLCTGMTVYTYDGTVYANSGSGSLDEYLPINCNSNELLLGKPLSDKVVIDEFDKNYTNINMVVTNPNSSVETIILPLIGYDGYKAIDSEGNNLVLTKDDNSRLSLCVPGGYQGTIDITYSGMLYWRICEILSLVFIFIFMCDIIKQIKSSY